MPPGLRSIVRSEARLLEDACETPSGEIGERRGLGLAAAMEIRKVLRSGRACLGRSGPGMANNVTCLEILLVLGLLEDQIFRKGSRRVTDMQARVNHL